MSVRSELRAAAMERALFGCEWPPAHHPIGRLEMAHVIPLGSGGRDEISNVWMLCKYHHDMYDGREKRSLGEQRRLVQAYLSLLRGEEIKR